jgi:hypothetical protein
MKCFRWSVFDAVLFDEVLFDEVLAWLKASIRVASGNFSSFHGDHAEGIHKVFASPGVSIRGGLVEIAIDRNPARRDDGNQ